MTSSMPSLDEWMGRAPALEPAGDPVAGTDRIAY